MKVKTMNSNEYDNVFSRNGIEIKINDTDFLKIKETLTRIGIASNKNKTLYQSCHILHKRGMYGILHFKELFVLDKKFSDIEVSDYDRRNYIVKLLHDWKLIKIDNSNYKDDIDKEIIKNIKILPFGEKSSWNLVSKYTIGK